MSALPKIVVEPLQVHTRLRELQLTGDTLLACLQAGASALALCTLNHPSFYPGLSFWAEAVRALRDMLMREGWTRDDTRNYATVVRGDRVIAIAIARGDEWTGKVEAPQGRPSTQNRKGIATQQAVERNQLALFDILPPDDVIGADARISTWVLLHHRDRERIYCELSRPTAINASGFVETWDERIILSTIELEPARIPVVDDAPVEPVVTVKRRS